MIIGVDVRVSTRNKTGVAYLLENLVLPLIEKDTKNFYKLFGFNFGIKSINQKTYVYPKLFQRGINLLWRIIKFPPVNVFLGKTDQFLFLNFVDFPVFAKRKILMIPDMSFIKFPQFTEKKNLKFLRKGVERSLRKADIILTISENAKDEICEHYGLNRSLVEVVYPGCPNKVTIIKDKKNIDEAKNKYKIDSQYILFFGTIEPRKNLKRLIEAYWSLPDSLKENYKLVLAGGKGWYHNEIFDIVKEKKLENRVIFTGYIDENDRSAIYSGASLFVLPSLYEGFGLPVLEAFACGVPVVCSDASSIPEVGGDAVLYFNPSSTEEMVTIISSALLDNNLKKKLVSKGFERLKLFSWENSIKKMINIINS